MSSVTFLAPSTAPSLPVVSPPVDVCTLAASLTATLQPIVVVLSQYTSQLTMNPGLMFFKFFSAPKKQKVSNLATYIPYENDKEYYGIYYPV